MSIGTEGRIDIIVTHDGVRVTEVNVHSTRPRPAQRLMAGRTPDEASHLAGLVFSLCGKAQQAAAQAACAAAMMPPPEDSAYRPLEHAVLVELAMEHLWRLLVDWPQQSADGGLPDMHAMRALHQAASDTAGFAEVLTEKLTTCMLGESPRDWLARDLGGLEAWCEAGSTATARLFAGLPARSDIGIGATTLLPSLEQLGTKLLPEMAWLALNDTGFCAQPRWGGAAAETGALVRRQKHPMLAAWIAQRGRGAGARMLARLLELAHVPVWMDHGGCRVVRAQSLGNGLGVAGVETARGLLIHVAHLQNGRVKEYRIVAPTEWNFHPTGPLARALGSLDPREDFERNARLACQSFDPCVAFNMEINHA